MSLKKQVFKAALDVPWREWPEVVTEDAASSLINIISSHQQDHSTDINTITSQVSSGTHNCVVAAKLKDGFPFFVRHIPPCVYSSNGFLFVMEESDFVKLLESMNIVKSCRVLSFKVSLEQLSLFKPFCMSSEYSADVALMKKLIKQ